MIVLRICQEYLHDRLCKEVVVARLYTCVRNQNTSSYYLNTFSYNFATTMIVSVVPTTTNLILLCAIVATKYKPRYDYNKYNDYYDD